jgi:hypothetical protein
VRVETQDSRAKAIVKEYANKISMDVAGKALSSVGEMVGKVFVLWGWKYLGEKVSATLEKEMSAEFRSQVPPACRVVSTQTHALRLQRFLSWFC